jgi:hypothetical protein
MSPEWLDYAVAVAEVMVRQQRVTLHLELADQHAHVAELLSAKLGMATPKGEQ